MGGSLRIQCVMMKLLRRCYSSMLLVPCPLCKSLSQLPQTQRQTLPLVALLEISLAKQLHLNASTSPLPWAAVFACQRVT